jgi:hypothetical protein
MGVASLSVSLALMSLIGPSHDTAQERIYGRVLLTDGEVVEGYLEWNERASVWADFLDGAKEIPVEFLDEAERLDPEYAEERQRARSLEAFGVRITWDVDDDATPVTSAAAIRFGHIASLVTMEDRRVLLQLRSGQEVVMGSLRSVIVDSPGASPIQLRRRQVERIDFMTAPEAAELPSADRLYGTVQIHGGAEFTGHIAWDLDETLTSDVLNGRQDGEDFDIPFSDISEIEWESTRASRVLLRSGERLLLRGTNDVDRDNRGIEISDVAFGRVTVPWEEFRSISFRTQNEPSEPRDAFDGGAPLTGTVFARDGRQINGEIRWDNDEASDWEVLDGWSGGIDYDITFSAIRTITRSGSDGVAVTLLDGRELLLDESNDVSVGHRGMYVKPEGRSRRLIRWADFDRVVFNR